MLAIPESSLDALYRMRSDSVCEIAEGAKADWYLVRTFPGDDLKAMRWLARRRFGVFRPTQQRRASRNDHRLVQGREAMFPGWLFVFCWDIGTMRDRILACPGVMQILCYPDTVRPVPIDERGFIDRLRAIADDYSENAPHARAYTIARRNTVRIAKGRRPRLDKHRRKQLHTLKERAKIELHWDEETWKSINELDANARISVLLQALNAPSL